MIVGTCKLLPVIFAMVLTIPAVYSQKGYDAGYVILNNGDTIYGRIKDRDLSRDRLYPKIRFRGEHSGRRKYSPYQVRGYRLGDTEFDAKWFMEEAAFFRFDYFCREGTGEKVFLKVLARGPLTCYFREYIDAESGYLDGYELFQRDGEDYYERATQGILGLKKKRLSVYFADCPSLVMRIRNGQITHPVEVVDFYHSHCSRE